MTEQSDPDYRFKTVHFPRQRVRRGSAARVTISIPTNHGSSSAFLAYVHSLGSHDFRLAVGDPYLEDIEQEAVKAGESVSTICVRRLALHYAQVESARGPAQALLEQPNLPLEAGDVLHDNERTEPASDLGVTFRDSLRQGVYGWYPYVEGFAATYARDAILRYRPQAVYDPFGGSGTTQLAAALLNVPSYYSEINPFMCFVAETKVACASWARQHLASFRRACGDFLGGITSKRFQRLVDQVDLQPYADAFPERDFFDERHVRQLMAAVTLAKESKSSSARDIFLLACAANAVRSSHMTRRADLRRRRPDEYKTRVVDVASFLSETLHRYLTDVESLPLAMGPMTRVSEDARALPDSFSGRFDFALTSPPYLNGTNYFRNTKIELWLLGFIVSETELGAFNRRAIAAGINNVSRDRTAEHVFEPVEAVVSKLEATRGDKRIALLVRQYFSDMFDLCSAVHRSLAPSGTLLLDIGDSRFYGVHVPTDTLLAHVATRAGLSLKRRHVLARRHSRDKTPLVQVELVLEKAPRSRSSIASVTGADVDLATRARSFQAELPYKRAPYSKRNWGHPLHSLCSYQGKLKPSLAHWLVRSFVPPRGRVLDPLGGVGTIAFEAALQGHEAVSNDMSPFAAIVARAKLAPPTFSEATAALDRVWSLAQALPKAQLDFDSAEFGLNGAVREFYHPRTLEEVLRVRTVFLKGESHSNADAFLWASLLHILHGNRPYALSRMSHPITPFRPTGKAVYKDVREKLQARMVAALRAPLPSDFVPGCGTNADFRELTQGRLGRFDAIITSPPFPGMRFDRPNWLRMWFCGWGADDFHKRSLAFLERQQTKTRACYEEFFSSMSGLLSHNGVLILHVGSSRSHAFVEELRALAEVAFRLEAEVKEDVQSLEQHGIRDKGGLTTHHHLLFLHRR